MNRKTIVLVVPGRLESRTGGYEYDRRLAGGLRERGWQVDICELAGSFPEPTRADLDAADRALARIPDDDIVLIDGLAFGAMPDEAARHAARLRLVPIVHMPLASAPGLEPAAADRLLASEKRALEAARAIVVTGDATASTLERFQLRAPIVVIEPGTDIAPLARGSGSDSVHILCVATINAGKGHDLLIEALAPLRHLPWQLTCAGSVDRDPVTAGRIRESVKRHALDDRVTFAGELDRSSLDALYDRADLFVLPSLSETFGMAVAEAIAHGLPVVSTTTGAIPKLAGEGGRLVPPGDGEALAVELTRLLENRASIDALAAGARKARSRLRTWDVAVALAEDMLQSRALLSRS